MVLFWFWLAVVLWNTGVDISLCMFGVLVWAAVPPEGFLERFHDDNEKHGTLKDVKKQTYSTSVNQNFTMVNYALHILLDI